MESNVRDRQPEDGTGMQVKLGKVLRNHGHHPRIMGPGADFAEKNLVTLDEEFHAKNPAAAQSPGHQTGNTPGFFHSLGTHRLGLPGFLIVTAHLMMAHRFQERGAAGMTDGQLGDFVIKIHKAFHNDLTGTGTAAFLCITPGFINIRFGMDGTLAVAGGTHDRLDHAGNADLLDRRIKFRTVRCKTVGRSFDTQFFGGQTADAFAVHGQPGSPGRGNHGETFFFQFHQSIGGNGLHFRNDIVRLFRFNDFSECFPIQHGDHMRPMCHLHPRSIGVAIHGYDFHAQPLHSDRHFFAKFPCTAEQYFGCTRRQRTAQFHTHCFTLSNLSIKIYRTIAPTNSETAEILCRSI